MAKKSVVKDIMESMSNALGEIAKAAPKKAKKRAAKKSKKAVPKKSAKKGKKSKRG